MLYQLADYLRYEAAQGREMILACPDHDLLVRKALETAPASHVVRAIDPQWIVHSTSIERGKKTMEKQEIRSQHLLIHEKYLPNHHVGYATLDEPADYLDHVNFAALVSRYPEAVTQSNQTGAFGGFDRTYQPGIRFYFDARQLITSGNMLRVGALFENTVPRFPSAILFCVSLGNGLLRTK